MASETWVLNEFPDFHSAVDVEIPFSSANNSYTRIRVDNVDDRLLYDSTIVYGGDGGGWLDQTYRTIAFNTAPTGTLLTWLQANGTKQAAPKVTVDLTSLSGYESLPAGTYALGVKAKAANYQDSDLSATVSFTKLAAPVATASDTTVTWDAVTNADSYDVYVDGELYENTTGGVTYNITTTVTNGTYSGDSTITDTATITITADSGYKLPDTVTVTGASQMWNKETGTLTLSNPTGNVTVSVVCVKSAINNVTIKALFPGASYGDVYYKLNGGNEIQIPCTNTNSIGNNWVETVALPSVTKLEIMITGGDVSYYQIGEGSDTSMNMYAWYDISSQLYDNVVVTVYTDD